MGRDPLHFFEHEKVAEDSAPTSSMEDHRIPRTVSKSSLDPGERALAGIAATSGSIFTMLTPIIARMAVAGHLNEGSVDWKGAVPIQDAKSIAHGLSQPPASSTKAKLLNLFDITGRTRTIPTDPVALKAYNKKYMDKLLEVQPVVDSFIHKHKLAEKGVRINIQSGLLSGSAGGGFNLANKQVNIPRVGKALALHELGHAADYTGRFGKARRFAQPVLKGGVMVALPIALAAGDRIKEMIPGTIDDKVISFMQENAPAIMGATIAATTLFPEAKASFLAVRHLKEMEVAGKQPRGTALKAAKKLLPFWGTYLLGAVPAIVGMSLARKYMRAARAEKEELDGNIENEIRHIEKKAGMMSDFLSHAKDLTHVAKQVGKGTTRLISDKGTLDRIGRAAKETGQSPEFVWGAVSAALPAALGALYVYGTPGGEVIRERLDPEARDVLLGHTPKQAPGASRKDEEWRKNNPLRFAGLVAMGAALAGGITTKFMHDLTRVL